MRARLILLVAATSSLILVAFLVPLAILVRASAADRALSAAIVDVQALAPTVATAEEDALAQTVEAANASSARSLTVFLPNGRVLGEPAPTSAAVAQAATGHSLTAEVPEGREIAVAVLGLPEGTAVIRTVVTDAELTQGVGRSWLVLALLGLGLLLLSTVVADRLARTLTRPITAAANASYRLAQGALGARAPDEGPPEVRQVSAGLNLLAGRITELLAQERATVADLSHRLRTPLTALRIDVESLPDARDRDRLAADLDAIERTVDDVIREAERPVREGVAASCDAAAVIADRVYFWSALAEEQGRPVQVTGPAGPLPVRLSEEDLAACIDALIGNVFAHTPEGTAFGVGLVPRPHGGAALVVSDSGPGLAGTAAMGRGVSGAGSTGLGLDIVTRTAARSGGSVHIGRSAAGGAEVTVELGPPAAKAIRSHRDQRVIPLTP
jgi:signal transduction histidine kinase